MAYQSFIARCSVKDKWLAWVVYDQTFTQRWPTNQTAYGLSVTQTCTVKPLPTNLWQWKTGVQCAKAWITPLLHAQGVNWSVPYPPKARNSAICATIIMGNAGLVEIVFSVMCVVSAGVLTQNQAAAKERSRNLEIRTPKDKERHYCDQVICNCRLVICNCRTLHIAMVGYNIVLN